MTNTIKKTSLPKNRDVPVETNKTMEECDECFKKYLEELNKNYQNRYWWHTFPYFANNIKETVYIILIQTKRGRLSLKNNKDSNNYFKSNYKSKCRTLKRKFDQAGEVPIIIKYQFESNPVILV